jgi:hypothetical protein
VVGELVARPYGSRRCFLVLFDRSGEGLMIASRNRLDNLRYLIIETAFPNAERDLAIRPDTCTQTCFTLNCASCAMRRKSLSRT